MHSQLNERMHLTFPAGSSSKGRTCSEETSLALQPHPPPTRTALTYA